MNVIRGLSYEVDTCGRLGPCFARMVAMLRQNYDFQWIWRWGRNSVFPRFGVQLPDGWIKVFEVGPNDSWYPVEDR